MEPRIRAIKYMYANVNANCDIRLSGRISSVRETETETHHNERNQNIEHDKDSDRRADIGLRLVQRHVGEHGLSARARVLDGTSRQIR